MASITMRHVIDYRARLQPDAICIRDLGLKEDYTWTRLACLCDTVASFCVNTLRLKKGDRLGLMCDNNTYSIAALLSSCTTGVVVDTFNQRLISSELEEMARREGPKAIICQRTSFDKARSMAAAVGDCALVCIDDAAGAQYSRADIDAYCGIEYEHSNLEFEDVQMLIHTGGTTGLPKAAMLSQRCLLMNAVSEALCWKLSSDDRAYAAMPFYHTAGWNVLTIPMLVAGGVVTISGGFSSDVFLDLVESGELTIFMGADTMFRAVASHPRFQGTDFSRVRFLCCGGGPASQASIDAFHARGIPLTVGYGMSEYGPNVAAPNPDIDFDSIAWKPFSIGKAMMFTQMKVVTSDGGEARAGEYGEIWLRGALAFNGYWNNLQATAETICDGWVKTGDIGYLDADGDAFLCGRKKNMYISGGENVFPIEAERAIDAFPAVEEACVVGVPDNRWGEVGFAFVVAKKGMEIDVDELKSWLIGRLSTIKQPKHYAVVDAIQKNAAGKLNMRKMKEDAMNRLGRCV